MCVCVCVYLQSGGEYAQAVQAVVELGVGRPAQERLSELRLTPEL